MFQDSVCLSNHDFVGLCEATDSICSNRYDDGSCDRSHLGFLCCIERLLLNAYFFQRQRSIVTSKAVKEKTMKEDVATADLTKEDPFRHILEKARIVPSDSMFMPEEPA